MYWRPGRCGRRRRALSAAISPNRKHVLQGSSASSRDAAGGKERANSRAAVAIGANGAGGGSCFLMLHSCFLMLHAHHACASTPYVHLCVRARACVRTSKPAGHTTHICPMYVARASATRAPPPPSKRRLSGRAVRGAARNQNEADDRRDTDQHP